jgi:hypothetical protein
MNALAVLVSGYITLKALGLEPSTYYKKKDAESMRKAIPIGIVLIMLLGIPLSFSFYEAPAVTDVESEAEEFFGDQLVDIRRNQGDFTVVAAGNFSKEQFQQRFDERKIDVILLERK